MPETRYGFPPDAFDPLNLPDYDHEFLASGHLDEFAKALIAPDTDSFVSLNDWKPVHQRVRRKLPHAPTGRRRRKPRRSRDETREGFMYTIFKWPLLLIILSWIVGLGASYWLTRLYVWAYEGLVTWRGSRQRLRRRVRSATSYEDWRRAAQELDGHLGNEGWKDTAAYAYYDHATIARAAEQLKVGLRLAQDQGQDPLSGEATAALRAMVESCVKTNFVGLENPRLYSETYYGTKHLAQDFVDELHASLAYLFRSPRIEKQAKYQLAKQLHTNFGRTALCLSGGLTLPGIISGLPRRFWIDPYFPISSRAPVAVLLWRLSFAPEPMSSFGHSSCHPWLTESKRAQNPSRHVCILLRDVHSSDTV